MVMGEVDLGIRPADIPPTIQVKMVHCCVYLLIIVVFTEVFIETKEVILVAII